MMRKQGMRRILPLKKEVIITVPNRIHMFTYRAAFNVDGKTGGAGISIKSGQSMHVRIADSQFDEKNPIFCYFISVFKDIFGYDGSFEIDYKNNLEQHIGLGTTISQTVALCYAINYLFGRPLSDVQIRKLIMEEYKEIAHGKLIRGLGTGVGTVCSLYGGINFVTNSRNFVHFTPPCKFAVLTFIPADTHFQKRIMLDEENSQKKLSFMADEDSLQQRNRLVFDKFIPALLSENWNLLGRTTAEIHTLGVKKLECERYNYEYEVDLINLLLDNGILLTGLSSLGPINYAVVPWDKAEWLQGYLVENQIASDVHIFELCDRGIEIVYEN